MERKWTLGQTHGGAEDRQEGGEGSGYRGRIN